MGQKSSKQNQNDFAIYKNPILQVYINSRPVDTSTIFSTQAQKTVKLRWT